MAGFWRITFCGARESWFSDRMAFGVLDRVPALILVVPQVMKLQHSSGVVAGPHGSVPAALDALRTVSLQDGQAHRVRYDAVVRVGLPVFFEDVDANREVVAAAVPGDDGPALLGAEFVDSARPFFLNLWRDTSVLRQ